MNEHSYTRAIVSKLPSGIHVQSMTSASLNNNGTPDRYIDGPASDLWVEFKFLPRTPKVLRPYELLSAQQMAWLKRRGSRGNAIVVIGFRISERKAAGLILDVPSTWEIDHAKDAYSIQLLSNIDVSNYLARRVS